MSARSRSATAAMRRCWCSTCPPCIEQLAGRHAVEACLPDLMREGGMRAKGNWSVGLWAGLWLGVLALSACQKAEAPAAAKASAWPQFVESWIESDLKANPISASYQGRHEYDGLFPD